LTNLVRFVTTLGMVTYKLSCTGNHGGLLAQMLEGHGHNGLGLHLDVEITKRIAPVNPARAGHVRFMFLPRCPGATGRHTIVSTPYLLNS
jgi:hypothetical protein